VLSWRVVSADGHPVGGSLLFSVGAPSEGAAAAPGSGNISVPSMLWAAKVVIYVGLFLGIGGVFFRSWIDPAAASRGLSVALLAAGLIATPLSVGVQGLDALDLPVASLAQTEVWRAGWETAYGLTALTAGCAMLCSLLALAMPIRLARPLALVSLLGIGLALMLSGHAGTVEPRLLTRSAVFLHGVCVAFWVGAFVPLVVAIRSGEGMALARFSRLIPPVLAIVVATGGLLAFVQLDRIDALWTTRYGLLLTAKLVLVAALLALAAANRYVLTPQLLAGAAARPLKASIRIELVLALGILGLVASWRFTPPPRALPVSEQVFLHIHGERGMAEIDIRPERGRAKTSVKLMDLELHPLAAKELTLVLANAAAGIEPMRRSGVHEDGAYWHIDDLRIPRAGRWQVRVEILVSDFEKIVVEEDTDLPRLP
jgi:copper transport protein